MKTKPLLLSAAGLMLLVAGLLVPDSAPPSAAPAAPVAATKRLRPARPAPVEIPAAPRDDRGEESAHLAAWRDRFDALLRESGDPEAARKTLLAEIDETYRTWVAGQLTPVTALDPAERYDELADIERTVADGTAAILDQLGLDESHRLAVAAGPAEAISAEVPYAEAARDSGSRLALLRLDRERQERLEQALALTDDAAKTQAIAELDAWYDAGLGGIFATPAAPDQDL
jgi:hypothetical protein